MMRGDRKSEDQAMTAAAGVIGGVGHQALETLAEAVSRRQESLAGLLDAARAGDADAFAALVRQFQHPIYQFVLRLVRRTSTADDLSQEVFIRMWRHLGEIESADLLHGWLRRVAANAVIDHWRKEEVRKRRLQRVREHPVARYTLKPSSRMETSEAFDTVRAALDELPVRLRSVLLLRTIEELSYEEVAEVLGLSVHAVRSRLFRARQELHKSLRRKKAADYLAKMYRLPQRP